MVLFADTDEECEIKSSEKIYFSTDLKINKIDEKKLCDDAIICDDMMVEESLEASSAIQAEWLLKTSNQSKHDQWSGIDNNQKRQSLKLNLANEGVFEEKKNNEHYIENSETQNTNATMVLLERKISLGGNYSSNTGSSSSIPKEDESCSPSPSLARSSNTDDGFRVKKWLVDRTPTNTPDSVRTLTERVPHLSDEEEEAEDTNSINSETDPISNGSGTSSFLPSSVEVSDNRAGSLQDKSLKNNACGKKADSAKKAEDNNVQNIQSITTHPVVPAEESNIVLPPAGFTDSPVKNLPADTGSSVSKVLGTSERKNLLFKPLKEFRQALEYELSENPEKTYHHPELVVCQKQGISQKESFPDKVNC